MKRDEIIPINIPIYNTCLWVFFGSKENCANALQKNGLSERAAKAFLAEVNDEQCNGIYIYNKEENVALLWAKKIPVTIMEYATLVHEIEHTVFYLFERIGIQHTRESDEAYAYLQGYLFAEIDCAINTLKENESSEKKKE